MHEMPCLVMLCHDLRDTVPTVFQSQAHNSEKLEEQGKGKMTSEDTVLTLNELIDNSVTHETRVTFVDEDSMS